MYTERNGDGQLRAPSASKRDYLVARHVSGTEENITAIKGLPPLLS